MREQCIHNLGLMAKDGVQKRCSALVGVVRISVRPMIQKKLNHRETTRS